MATVRLAADKATLDVSWTNYFTECKSKGRAYFKGKIQTGGGKAGAQGAASPLPPAGAAQGEMLTIQCDQNLLCKHGHSLLRN